MHGETDRGLSQDQILSAVILRVAVIRVEPFTVGAQTETLIRGDISIGGDRWKLCLAA